MKVYFASDHAGFALKNTLINFLQPLGYVIEDCGAFAFDEADDYPAYVAKAAKAVAESTDKMCCGITIGASGQGEAMVANRFKGVRAAVYYGGGREQIDASGKTFDIIASSRAHNNANVLALGARFLSEEEAKEAVERWLTMPFSGEERHHRRITQIDEYGG